MPAPMAAGSADFTSVASKGTDCSSVTERPSRKGIVYKETIVPQMPATNAPAGSTSSTDTPASVQKESPWRRVPNTLA